MIWQSLFYLLPYLLSLGISTAVGISAWRQRAVLGARTFSIYVLAEASMTLGFIVELVSPSLESKIFWDNFQFIGSFVAPIAFLTFTLRYTRRAVPRPRRIWWVLGVLAAAFLIVIYTDPLHGLVRRTPELVPLEPFAVLDYGYTLTIWLFMLYIFGIATYCVGVFVQEFIRTEPSRRAQVGIILIGSLFPFLSAILSSVELETGLPRDLTPFGFALGNLVVAWGVFHYRLFDLVPVARRRVLENMVDAVMVIDADRRVVDLNAAAESAIGLSASEMLGQPADVAFDQWPDLVATFRDTEEGKAEVTYVVSGRERTVDLTISPLRDERGYLVGRVLVARDITARRAAEQALQRAHDELERRVEERTAELQASEERYRLLAENVDDVLWTRDASLEWYTYVSPSIVRLLGYTPEEMMAGPAIDFIAPSSYEIVERARRQRLAAEAAGAGDDSPRTWELEWLRRDGSTVWVESRTRVLRGETGQFQGVIGVTRDISERKAVEQALRDSEVALRRAQAVSHTGSWSIDISTDQVTWSDEAYRIFGTPIGTPITYQVFLEHVHPQDREVVDRAWNGALRREPYDVEHRIIVDGGVKWVREQAEVEFDADGQPIYAVGTVQDITAQKESVETLRQYTERLQILYEISEGIIVSRSPQAIAQVAMDFIRQLVPSMGIIIAVADRQNNQIEFLSTDLGTRLSLMEKVGSLADQRMIFSDVSENLRKGQVQLVDLEHPRSKLSEVLKAAGARAICHVPLLVQKELIGSMAIAVSDPTAFTGEHLDIVRRVADQLAIAVHEAQLHEQAQQYAEELEQMNRALAFLNEAGRTFSSTLDQDQVFNIILEEAHHLLDVPAIAIWMPDPESEELVCQRAAGPAGNMILGWRLPMEGSIAGWVARHGESQIVADTEKDERSFKQGVEHTGMEVRSVIAVPLRFKDDVVGVLEAVGMEPDHFTVDDLALLEPLAASAVIAIDNARLFEEVHSAREQLRALSRNLVDIQEAERAAVARELHDEAGQSLSYLLLALGMLEREASDADAVVARSRTLEGMIETLLENLHRLSVRLRPASLDHLGLVPALEQYIETFVNQYGVDTQFAAISVGEERFSSEVETALYRVVQEALTNVARHAEASHVDVLLEHRSDRVVVVVEDNGVGFDVKAAKEQGRLGLVGMRERAHMLGGTWTIESMPGQGTTIVVEVPHADSDSDR